MLYDQPSNVSVLKNIWEYIPLMIITVFFVAETDISKSLFSKTCNILFMLILFIFLYISIVLFKIKRIYVGIIAIALWVIFIYAKRYVLNR